MLEVGEFEVHPKGLDVNDVVPVGPDDAKLDFTVVALLEDDENGTPYAVLMYESAEDDEQTFIVTDVDGKMLEDEALAQDILDDYLALVDEQDENGKV